MHSVTSNAVAQKVASLVIKKDYTISATTDPIADIKTLVRQFISDYPNPNQVVASGEYWRLGISWGFYELQIYYISTTVYNVNGIVETSTSDNKYKHFYKVCLDVNNSVETWDIEDIYNPTVQTITPTKIDARFVPNTTTIISVKRKGDVVNVYFGTYGVYANYNHFDACFTGLPKPIVDNVIAYSEWGGRVTQTSMVVNSNGELCTYGNANLTQDEVVSLECFITYLTNDTY